MRIPPRAWPVVAAAPGTPPGGRPSQRDVKFEIVWSDGTPVEWADFAVCREGAVVDRGQTYTSGTFETHAESGPVEFVVDATTRVVRERLASLDPGRHRIVVPSGEAIAGRVLVDGASPGRPVEITLARAADDADRARLPGIVRDALRHGAAAATKVATAPDGMFRRDGFDRGWEGRLLVRGDAFAIAAASGATLPTGGPGRVAGVTAPAEDVELRLHRRPVVRGRVVGLDQPEAWGLEDAVVDLWFREGPVRTGTAGFPIGSDARFEVPLGREAFEEAAPEITDRWTSRRTIRIAGPATADVDLGDVGLDPPRAVVFVVRAGSGEPVPGATVRDTGRRRLFEGMTGADGRIERETPVEASEARVSAPGYLSRDVVVPEGIDGEFPVVLARGTRLDVRIAAPPAGEETEVRLSLGPGTPGSGMPFDEAGLSWGPYPGGIQSGGNAAWFPFPPGHVLAISGLRAGVPIRIEASAPPHCVLATASVELRPAEWKNVVLDIARAPRALNGFVVDPAGRPVPSAAVSAPELFSAMTLQPSAIWYLADRSGRFTWPGLRVDRMDLAVHGLGVGPGFLPLILRDWPLPREGVDARFVVQPGRTVTVSVVDAAGEPFQRPMNVNGAWLPVWIEAPGFDGIPWFPRQLTEPGCRETFAGGGPRTGLGKAVYRFEGLPEGRVTFRVEVSQREVRSFPLETSRSEARVVMPTQGRLLATWTFPLPEVSRHRLRYGRAEDPGGALTALDDDVSAELGTASIRALDAGAWEVWLERGVGPPFSETVWEPITPRVPVTVRPGTLARIALDPR